MAPAPTLRNERHPMPPAAGQVSHTPRPPPARRSTVCPRAITMCQMSQVLLRGEGQLAWEFVALHAGPVAGGEYRVCVLCNGRVTDM